MICENITVNSKGNLCFAGYDTVELANQYSTPLYIMDEERIRKNCRIYRDSMMQHFGENAMPVYASKALSFKKIYQIMKQESIGIDVVSSGEIYTAVKAGYPLEMAFFHSNNKTDFDICFAMDNNIGYFVVDNIEEVNAIYNEAARRGITQKILLRLTPGIDTHTYEAVNTGKVDSKFGTAIETGQAGQITEYVLSKNQHIDLCGFHCHVGSQVFGEDVFEKAAVIMLNFIYEMNQKHGLVTRVLDLGGGYGVRYTQDDPVIDINKKIGEVARVIKQRVKELNINMPVILMEPGRSIVADAGMTLYTVGTIKQITGYKNYVSIDGGMPDNPRYALYRSNYTAILANRASEQADFRCDIVGRCCESGDIIKTDANIPKPKRGDIIAVCTTGAYNYSMASNYNRIPRPPVVMLNKNGSYLAVKRETFEDLVSNDV